MFYTLKVYTSSNPDFDFDVEFSDAQLKSDDAAELVAGTIADRINYTCDAQIAFIDAANSMVSYEEREDLADDKEPGQRVFLYYDYCRKCESLEEIENCTCDAEIYMVTLDPIDD